MKIKSLVPGTLCSTTNTFYWKRVQCPTHTHLWLHSIILFSQIVISVDVHVSLPEKGLWLTLISVLSLVINLIFNIGISRRNRFEVLSHETSTLSKMGNSDLKRVQTKSSIWSLVPGSSSPNWLLGNARISNPN